MDNKEIKPVNPTGRTDADVEALIIWLPDVNTQLIEKDPDARKD